MKFIEVEPNNAVPGYENVDCLFLDIKRIVSFDHIEYGEIRASAVKYEMPDGSTERIETNNSGHEIAKLIQEAQNG